MINIRAERIQQERSERARRLASVRAATIFGPEQEKETSFCGARSGFTRCVPKVRPVDRYYPPKNEKN